MPTAINDVGKNGFADHFIKEEEGLNNHDVILKCLEIQTAITTKHGGFRLRFFGPRFLKLPKAPFLKKRGLKIKGSTVFFKWGLSRGLKPRF